MYWLLKKNGQIKTQIVNLTDETIVIGLSCDNNMEAWWDNFSFGVNNNFSFSAVKTKWTVIDFSKHTIVGTAAETCLNFLQIQISVSLGLKTVYILSKN